MPTIRPLIVVSLLAAAAGLHAGQEPPQAEPRVIEITARRYAFEPATIEAVVGERIRLVMRSADGVHGLAIEKLDVRKEIPRGGMPVTVEFTADEPGRYPILCSEYCGNGHEEMTGTLVVHVAGAAEHRPD